ncbi:protein of unknown function (plasmid) [Methylocella tundrae]|uniref:Uncharacterized protein n=1 Tax=Methylocella tundrae TaxID=227605 RepID=A0A4U8Z7P4_METTU|nr:protein of unknown function [Methylocella tundrae]
MMAAHHTGFVRRVAAALHGLDVAATELSAKDALIASREAMYRETVASQMESYPGRRQSHAALAGRGREAAGKGRPFVAIVAQPDVSRGRCDAWRAAGRDWRK